MSPWGACRVCATRERKRARGSETGATPPPSRASKAARSDHRDAATSGTPREEAEVSPYGAHLS